jgi:Ferritin-like
MSQQAPIKLIPRNVAAARRGRSAASASRLIAGNPVSTRLESGVGNCFPGLECDLRNLERRFFPFLEVDILEGGQTEEIRIVAVDRAGVDAQQASGAMPAQVADVYRSIANDLTQGRVVRIVQIQGRFGPLGQLMVDIANLGIPSTGPNRRPPDAWTAIRLLVEDTDVQILVRRSGRSDRVLAGRRARYLDDGGALARMFLPGELTQSLCSPWTHDFRDCGCFYWASNHPDIATPPLPTPIPTEPEWNAAVRWQRQDRTLGVRPAPANASSATPFELDYFEINTRWQALNPVLEGRERTGPYQPGMFMGQPFGTAAELQQHLRYAAGVELAVVHEYLAAAYSLREPAEVPAVMRDDVAAARAELLRVAFSEMRHVRAVNDVLRSLPRQGAFVPALRVASRVPGIEPGQFRLVQVRPATPQAIEDFIAIELPSVSVDGLYARILATLDRDGTDEQEQTIRTVMAEGEEHFQTFLFIREWLRPHAPGAYLRGPNLTVPPPAQADHVLLQARYRAILGQLHDGYTSGLPSGRVDINTARMAMVGAGGLEGAAEVVAAAGFLVAFDVIPNEPRFQPVDPP